MTTANGAGAGRLLVVGGHGAVGRVVVGTLSGWYPGRVLAGGRSAPPGGVRVDVADPEGFGRVLDELGDIAAVVLCVEPPDARTAALCLARGIHLVDVGASHRLLDGVERAAGEAERTGAAAVLSVGVAPGLSNLLALRAHHDVGGAERIDLTVLLGTGERHGRDAVRWTVAGLSVPSAARSRRTALPGHGPRTAHPFPFSDQFTLPRTLGVPEVTTRLCLDSRPLTALLAALRHSRLARRTDLLTRVLGRVHLGGERFAVCAEAVRGPHRAARALTGSGQSRTTGLVAAHTAREVLAGRVPPGVHHIEQLPALADLPERLAGQGIALWGSAPGTHP
ncbi:saccharopine dehydrogenase [Streptomyces sp. NPDC048001]|uniref:saccharopine dehydrogenase n=1 Tax=Streptomyces sp. NPDC048001 TaxID=3365498 RepID=UPI0037234DDF